MYTKLKHRYYVSYYVHSNVVFSPLLAQTLHTSCIGQSSSPNHLRRLSVFDTCSFFLSMFWSLTLSTTQPPFSHSITKCIYLTHPPLNPMPSSPSHSNFPSHPLSLDTCIAYLAPNLSCARTHVVYLGHSLEAVSLFLPHDGPHSLNLALFIWVSFNLVLFHAQMIYPPVRASIDTLNTLSHRLFI